MDDYNDNKQLHEPNEEYFDRSGCGLLASFLVVALLFIIAFVIYMITA